jgi:hypothetical protein
MRPNVETKVRKVAETLAGVTKGRWDGQLQWWLQTAQDSLVVRKCGIADEFSEPDRGSWSGLRFIKLRSDDPRVKQLRMGDYTGIYDGSFSEVDLKIHSVGSRYRVYYVVRPRHVSVGSRISSDVVRNLSIPAVGQNFAATNA